MFQLSTTNLRRVLWLDAITGMGMFASHLILSDFLSGLTGLPADWLQVIALMVIVPATTSGWLASRSVPPRAGVRLLAIGNFAWVAASLWVAFGAGLALTPMGMGWVLMQALFVLVLAELEWAGTGRTPRLAAA